VTQHPKVDLKAALDGLSRQVCNIRDHVGIKWPYLRDIDTTQWDTTFDGDWCAGHWIECLRIASEQLDLPELAADADRRTSQVYGFLLRDDMFRGHRFYYGAARQFHRTKNLRHRDAALAAAWALRTTALPTGAMPIGTQVQVRLSPGVNTSRGANNRVAVDNVHPAIMLDWWAARQTGDSRFVEGARRHLDISTSRWPISFGKMVQRGSLSTTPHLPVKRLESLLRSAQAMRGVGPGGLPGLSVASCVVGRKPNMPPILTPLGEC